MTNICHKCTEIDALCTKCAAAAECLECQTGHYVNSEQSDTQPVKSLRKILPVSHFVQTL